MHCCLNTLFTGVKRQFFMFLLYAHTHTHTRTRDVTFILHWITYERMVCVYVEWVQYLPCGSVDSTCVIWLIRVLLMLAHGKIWAVRCKNHLRSSLRESCFRRFKPLSNLWESVAELSKCVAEEAQNQTPTIRSHWGLLLSATNARTVWICGMC